MSGGFFNYDQSRIRNMVDSLVVKIKKVLRIKSGQTYYNYVWDVDGEKSRNWFGFDTIDKCVEDCLTHLTIKNG